MKITGPYVDPRTTKKRSPDWLVTIQNGNCVHTHRFTSKEDAERATKTLHRVA